MFQRARIGTLLAAASILAAACASGEPAPGAGTPGPGRAEWALAIHGGAGTIARDLPSERREAYVSSLSAALRAGATMLDEGRSSLDVVEHVVRSLEDDPRFNAGRGAVFDRQGRHELDASIMDGATLACGAVAGVRTVRNPIVAARLVMERTEHVLLMGEGAERFAEAAGLAPVEPEYFSTPERREQWRRAREAQPEATASAGGGTVGAVALDRRGDLAAATSTGGLTNKRYGRVGDSPIVGAGTWADNRSCAVSATGRGEEFIRRAAAHTIAALVRYGGLGVTEAARQVIHHELRPGDGGVIALGRDGELALEFNTSGMYRGAADSTGRFEVRIWEDEE